MVRRPCADGGGGVWVEDSGYAATQESVPAQLHPAVWVCRVRCAARYDAPAVHTPKGAAVLQERYSRGAVRRGRSGLHLLVCGLHIRAAVTERRGLGA